MVDIIGTKFHKIGREQPCYVIAEIGSNHNGSYDMACELIGRAKEAGASAVKFQTFKAKSHYSKYTPKLDLYKEDIYELIESLEIDRSWHRRLSEYCVSLNIDFLDSPCDKEAIDLAVMVDMPILKVASFDMVDLSLIEYIAKTKRGVMFSTGMSNLSEIEKAVNICRSNHNDSIIILQCTSLYPAPSKLANLKVMQTIRSAFNVIVGYSDHTQGDHIGCAAVALGAKVVEKHYTLDRTLPGPDHNFAIEPSELKEMIFKIREIEESIGDGLKNGPRVEEREMYNVARRSLISNRDMPKGHIIGDSDIIIKRPGTGIHPHLKETLIGREVKIDIVADEPITWEKV